MSIRIFRKHFLCSRFKRRLGRPIIGLKIENTNVQYSNIRGKSRVLFFLRDIMTVRKYLRFLRYCRGKFVDLGKFKK